MMFDMKYTEIFDLYLQRKLGTADRLAFEERLKTDPDFAADFKLHKDVDFAILQDDVESFRSKLEDIREQNHDLISEETPMEVSHQLDNELDEAIVQQDVMALREQLDQIHAQVEEEAEVTGIPGYGKIDKAIIDQDSIQLKEELANYQNASPTNSDFTDSEKLELEVDEAIMQSEVIELRDKLSKIGKAITPERKVVSMQTRRLRIMTAAAAVLVVALVSSLFMSGVVGSMSPEKAFNKYYDAYPPDGFTRGGTNTDEVDLLKEGMKLYRTENYEAAIVLFDLVTKEEELPSRFFYSGVSAFMLEQWNEANDYFRKYLGTGENSYKEQVEFYMAGCLMKTDQKDQATELLQEISKNTRHYHRKDAEEMLQRIRF